MYRRESDGIGPTAQATAGESRYRRFRQSAFCAGMRPLLCASLCVCHEHANQACDDVSASHQHECVRILFRVFGSHINSRIPAHLVFPEDTQAGTLQLYY